MYSHHVWLHPQSVELYKAQVQASLAPMMMLQLPPSISPYPGSQLSLQLTCFPCPVTAVIVSTNLSNNRNDIIHLFHYFHLTCCIQCPKKVESIDYIGDAIPTTISYC